MCARIHVPEFSQKTLIIATQRIVPIRRAFFILALVYESLVNLKAFLTYCRPIGVVFNLNTEISVF